MRVSRFSWRWRSWVRTLRGHVDHDQPNTKANKCTRAGLLSKDHQDHPCPTPLSLTVNPDNDDNDGSYHDDISQVCGAQRVDPAGSSHHWGSHVCDGHRQGAWGQRERVVPADMTSHPSEGFPHERVSDQKHPAWIFPCDRGWWAHVPQNMCMSSMSGLYYTEESASLTDCVRLSGGSTGARGQ